MTRPPPQIDDDRTQARPSKSQLKREALDSQDLGLELLRLTDEQLRKLQLPDDLLDAVLQGRRLPQDGSLKRQRKFIAKLLRLADCEPIRAQVRSLTETRAEDTRLLHRIEAWRDRLLRDGDSAVSALLADFPAVDRPKLRSLIERARREAIESKSPRAARLLFQYLREIVSAETEPRSEV